MPSHIISALREDYDVADYLNTLELPAFHRIVLGLVDANLQTQLSISANSINAIDWQGRTALSWAAARGDAHSVQLLLSHGANPNLSSFNGSSPLQFSARARTPDCMELLLAAGADISQQNAWNQTAMTYATTLNDEPRLLEPLLRVGADVNHGDVKGWTALMKAVDRDNPRQVERLLAHGATFGEADGWGYRSLAAAITNNFHAILCSILEHKAADFERVSLSGLLRAARVHGDARTLEILGQAGLQEMAKMQGEGPPEFVPPREVAFTVARESKMISDGNWL